MAWGDDDVVVKPAPGGQAGYGQGDAVVKPAGQPKPRGAKKLVGDEALGFLKGAFQPIDNAADWLTSAIEKAPSVANAGAAAGRQLRKVIPQEVTDFIDNPQAFYQRQQAKGYKPGVAGQMGGSVLSGLPMLALTKNPAVLGGIGGALEGEKGSNVAQNAIAGAAMGHFGGKVADAAADLIAPVVDPAVRRLQQLGIKLTPGQIKGGKAMTAEDKNMSMPFVGDMIQQRRELGLDQFNRAAVDKALAPIVSRLPKDINTGHDAIAFAQQEVENAYNRVMPKVQLAPDARMMVGIRDAWNSLSDREAQQKFLDTMRTKLDFSNPRVSRYGPVKTKEVMRGYRPYTDNTMSPQRTAVALRDIRDIGNQYLNGTASEQMAGQALKDVHEALVQSLARQNPQVANQLLNANKAYQGLQTLNRAAKGADEGVFSTGQFKQAITGQDQSKNKRVAAAGQALMQDLSRDARAVLPSRQPNPSGTAAHVMSSDPIKNLIGAAKAGLFKLNDLGSQAKLRAISPMEERLGTLLRDIAPGAAYVTPSAVLNQAPPDEEE